MGGLSPEARSKVIKSQGSTSTSGKEHVGIKDVVTTTVTRANQPTIKRGAGAQPTVTPEDVAKQAEQNRQQAAYREARITKQRREIEQENIRAAQREKELTSSYTPPRAYEVSVQEYLPIGAEPSGVREAAKPPPSDMAPRPPKPSYANPEQVKRRTSAIEQQQAQMEASERRTQELEARKLAGEYNFQKPSAYQVDYKDLVPGNLPEEQRQEYLRFIEEQQPGLATKYSSVFAPRIGMLFTNFVTVPKGATAYSIGLTEGGPQQYSVNLFEGGEKYTLTFPGGQEIKGLSAREVREYEKTAKLAGQIYEFRREKGTRTEKENIANVREFVRNAKEQGYKTVIIKTPEGTKEIPIDKNTTREIVMTRNAISVSVVPQIPEGFTLAGSLASPMFVPTQETIMLAQAEAEQKARKEMFAKDPLGISKFIYEMEHTNPLVVGERGPEQVSPTKTSLGLYGAGLLASAGSMLTGTQNLARAGIIELYSGLGQKKLALGATLGSPELYTARDVTGEIITPPLMTTLNLGTGREVFESGVAGVESAKQLAAVQGPERTAAQITTFATPYLPIGKISKLAPLRYVRVPIYTAEGVQISQRVFAFGYGGKIVPLVGKYGPFGEGKFFIGKAKPELTGMEKIEAPVGGSSFERYQPANLTPAQQKLIKPSFEYAEKKGYTAPGFTTELEPKLIKAQKTEMSVPYEYLQMVPKKILGALPAGKATYNILSGLGKTVKQKLLEPAKGSIVPRLLKGGLSREMGDIDIEALSMEKAGKASEQLVKTEVGVGHELEQRGYNIAIKEKGKPETSEEIINIVTPKEEIKNVLGISTEKVYGMKYPTEKVGFKIPGSKQKLYTKTMQYQTRAKTASITGVETRESLLAEGLTEEQVSQIMGTHKFMRVPKGRRFEKDIMDRYMGEREAARVKFFSGNVAGAKESAQTMVSLQKYYGKMFDFGKAIREYRPEAYFEKGAEKSLGSKAEQSAKQIAKGSGKGAPTLVPVVSPRREERKKSAYESPKSAYSTLTRSPYTSKSVLSASVSPSSRSALSSKPSPSAKVESPLSAKSTFSKSSSSAKSISSARPSPVSPKPSPLSPRSVLSPPSPKPSPKPSPGPSPSIRPSPRVSPLSPISPLSLKVLPPPKTVSLTMPKGEKNPFTKGSEERRKKEVELGLKTYIGNVRVSEITGMYKRPETIYGERRTEKLAVKDILASGKGRFVKSKKSNLLSKPTQYFTPTKKQEKDWLKEKRTGVLNL